MKLDFDEWKTIGIILYGKNILHWKFICPACKKTQNGEDFLNFVPEEDINSYIGFSCIGRVNGKGNSFLNSNGDKGKYPNGCDWTVGGFLKIHKLTILKDNKEHYHFDFADDYSHLLNKTN